MTRRRADAAALRRLMTALGGRVKASTSIYLAGGATAVLHGWRASTDDVDLKVESDDEDEVVRILVALRDELSINIEFATPDHFIPVLAGWRDSSAFIYTEGAAVFRHFAYLPQALAKVNRWIAHDAEDVRAMLAQGLITTSSAWAYFEAIRPFLYRYPNIRETQFEQRMTIAFGPRPASQKSFS
jgi:hypothetical protein